MIIATAQFTISVLNDGKDGVGIVENIIEYCISSSGDIVPGSPLKDENNNIIYDVNGLILTDGAWSSTMPQAQEGNYIWTRSKTVYSDGKFALAYMVSRWGEDGAVGATGVSVLNVIPEYRLSDSSTTLTGTGAGYAWSEQKPKVENGNFIWQRQRNELSDGSVVYSAAVCDITLSNVTFNVDQAMKAIEGKVWVTDLNTAIDTSETVQSIRDRVSDLQIDIDGITTDVSDLQTNVSKKADGTTVTELTNRVATVEQTANGITSEVHRDYAKLTDVADQIGSIEIGARNLVLNSDVEKTSKNAITTYDLSPYGINVLPGQQIIISADIKSSVANSKLDTYIRTSSSDVWIDQAAIIDNIGTEYQRYSIVADVKDLEDGKALKWLAFRTNGTNGSDTSATYTIKNVKVEIGNKATTWSPAPEDALANIESVRTFAEQTADKFTWLVEDGSSESSITLTQNALTAMAEQIDLTGLVTFNSFDTATQNTINTASSNASNAISAVNNSIQKTTMHYLATSASSGVTKSTSGWTETIQSMTATKRYLWTYQTITRVGGTSYDTDPVISGVWGDKGETGGKGDTGVSVTKVEQLYRTSSSTTAPAKPTTVVTSTSTTYNTWTLAMPTYNATYPYYYTCTQTTYSDNSHTWTTVARSKAIEDANTTANTANTNASSAVSTANTANTNASTALSTANTASSNASTALTNSQNAQTAASNAKTAADNAQTTANQAVSSAETANDKVNPSLGMKINYSTFTTQDSGECYLHGYSSNIPADIDGYVYWKNRKITVPKMMLNPNTVVPYWVTAYIILRLSSGDASTGTLHMVWYKDGWKAHQANLTTSTSNVVAWSWDESTDIALGQFVSPSSDGNIVDAYLYNPPRNASHIITTGSNPYQYSSTAVNWVSNNGTGLLTAKDIVDNWKSDAVTGTTTINGGYIKTHTIESEHLATDAIMSNNYKASTNLASPYSVEGTFLDLANGNFWTPNFGVINVKPAKTSVPLGAWFNGTVYANAGHFGDSYIVGNDTIPSYWDIKTRYDKNNQPHAALVGTGSPYVQTANWQLSDNGLTTGVYKSTAASSGDYSYLYDSDNRTIYDMGVKTPTEFVTETDTTTDRYKKSVFYIRKYTLPNGVDSVTPPADDASWTYPFMVDTEGRVFISNLYLGTSGSATAFDSSAFLQKTGGTINGNLEVTGTLSVTGTINGTATYATSAGNVTGTVAVGNGGTGKTSWAVNRIIYASAETTLSQLAAGTSGYVLKSNGTSKAPGWVSQSDLSVGSATKATNDSDGNPINTTYRKIDDIKNLKIQLNSGTTEGTNQFTYNGSTAKNINITASSLGVGGFSGKSVDTSISDSSSTNIPTSAAVANFVEGKGYISSISGTSPISASTSDGATTISLANNYGDTKNPYAAKAKNLVLAGPTTGDNAAPGFRALVANDIPTLTPGKVGLGSVTNNKQVKAISSSVKNNLVMWSKTTGDTVADSGISKGGVATKLTLSGSDYSASSNTITVTQANLQAAVQSTDLLLMTAAERSKLSSIQVSSGGTIDFSGVTATSPLTATVAADKTVDISHNTSGVTAGTYRSVTVNIYGHVTAGTNPTTLSGYGITDAKIANGVITLGSNTITPLTSSSALDPTKLSSGSAGISITGNAGTADKFASAKSVTLTGDTTGTVSSQAGWSIATTTKKLTNSGRLASANVDNSSDTYLNKITYFLASANMTEGKPPIDSGIINFAWDNAKWGSQLAIKMNSTPHIYIRGNNNTSWDTSWLTILDSNNYTSYVPTKTGTGASGTWGINISGTAANATNDGDGNTISSSYLKLSGGTMTGGVTFPNDSSANNDKGIMFAKGSKIGENTSGVLGVYGNSLLYLRPMVGTAYGVLMSYSDISPTTNDEKYPLDLGKTNYPFTNTYSKSVYSKSVVIKTELTDNSGCRLEFSKDLNCLNFIFD